MAKGKLESQSIYVDSKNLRKLLKRSLFAMQHGDRQVYGVDVVQDTRMIIADFATAFEFEDERSSYYKKLVADFAVLKVDMEDIMEGNVIKNANPENLKMNPEALRTEIYKCIGNIDKGILKWRKTALGQV